MRRRNMYNMTGMPGWMRFGYSPGWVGRSASGLGPGAEYLMTGQWPNPAMAAAWQGMQAGQQPPMPDPYGMGMGVPFPQPNPQQEMEMLQAEMDMLEQQLEYLREYIASISEQE